MQRAEREFEALTRQPDQHPSFREQLQSLARAVAHKGELGHSFTTHIETLARLHRRVEDQLRHFHRNVEAARTAMAAARTTRVADPDTAPRRPASAPPEGFSHAPPAPVIERPRRGPRGKPGDKGKS